MSFRQSLYYWIYTSSQYGIEQGRRGVLEFFSLDFKAGLQIGQNSKYFLLKKGEKDSQENKLLNIKLNAQPGFLLL